MHTAACFRFVASALLSVVSAVAFAQNPGPMGPVCSPGQMKERTRFTIFDGDRMTDPALQRWWRKLEDNSWQEIYPNGYITSLRVEGPFVMNRVNGTLLRKQDDAKQEVFLPVTNSCDNRIFWRTAGVEWRPTAHMIDVAPPPGVNW